MQLAPFASTDSNAIGVPTYMDTLPQVGNLHQPDQPSTDQEIPSIPIGLVGFCLGSQYTPCKPFEVERFCVPGKWRRFRGGLVGFGWYCRDVSELESPDLFSQSGKRLVRLWQALWLLAANQQAAGLALAQHRNPKLTDRRYLNSQLAWALEQARKRASKGGATHA
jgi:hypothetical protein